MGDRRFEGPYRRLLQAQDRAAELQRLSDEEVIQALAHARMEDAALLSNVLATEAMNRIRRSRAALTHLGEGVLALDASGRIVEANPTALRLLGYARDELIGRDVHGALHFQDARGRAIPRERCAPLRALQERREFRFDAETFTRKDGERILVSGVYAPYGEGDGDGAIGPAEGGVIAFRDVGAERRQGELERRLAAVVEATDDAVSVETPEGVVIHWNAAAERLFGYAADEIVGRSIEALMPPERASDIEITRRVGRGERVSSHETERVHKDGTRVKVSLTLSPVIDGLGHIEGVAATYRDVTQRERAHEALRRSELRYRRLVEESPVSIQTFDPEGNALDANAQWERLWGAPRAALRGYNILRDPQLAEKGLLPDIARAFEGRRVELPITQYDPARLGREGRARWVKPTLYPLRYDDGRVAEVVLMHVDVTRDIEAREALREASEHYRLLVEGVRDYAMYMLDPDGRIVTWNPGAERLKGYAASEVLGKHFRMFYPEEALARDHPEHELREATEHGKYEEEGWRVRKDGTRFWAGVLITALRDPEGRLRGFAKVTRDLTPQRRAAEALRESEARYRRVVENSPAPIAMHVGGTLVFVNDAAVRLIGASSKDALLGRNVLDFVHEDSRALVVDRMRRILATGEILAPAEERLVRLDGEVIDVETVAVPVEYEGKRAAQILLRDITHQKREERRLREAAEDLERRVRERTIQLEQAMHDMETFTNSASHDLRAPLRGVEALTRALEEDYGPQLDEDGRRLIVSARRENQKAMRLVRALLSFARSGRGHLEPERVDVSTMARELAREILERHPERRTTWEIDDGIEAWADAGLLRIALNNLMSNASKYSERSERPRVRVHAERGESGETTVHVTDNGVGFPASEAYRLFGAFNRLSTAQGFEGTGLGLVAVQRIVTRHGGRAWAEGAVGQGATFSFTLPGPQDASG